MTGQVFRRFIISVIAMSGVSSPVLSQDGLYGSGIGPDDLAVACFSRHYGDAHLAAHPRQNVTRMRALAYRQPGTSNSVVNITVRFRNGTEEQQFPGECRAASGGLSCNVECDGGSYSVTLRDGKSVLVDLAAGIGACDGDLPQGQDFGTDDKVFRLDRAALANCRDMIWDDEMRPAILKAAGVAP